MMAKLPEVTKQENEKLNSYKPRLYVWREGKSYPLIKETLHEVCVEVNLLYADEPHERTIQVWWDKKNVTFIDRDSNECRKNIENNPS